MSCFQFVPEVTLTDNSINNALFRRCGHGGGCPVQSISAVDGYCQSDCSGKQFEMPIISVITAIWDYYEADLLMWNMRCTHDYHFCI